ncbi:AMP-binding protein [Caballeronia sordidicola]|uniref:AMP-binding protein n=1 Tax=Caballeronia sordidicola TaxID=196367 RepID=UPI000A37F228|nr:AMP-binding protein [Caballeronia sordidicola]
MDWKSPATDPASSTSQANVFNGSDEAISESQLTSFTAELSRQTGLAFSNYDSLHAFSVRDYRAFWKCFVNWLPGFEIIEGTTAICVGDECESAYFFPDLQLNYADKLLDLSVASAGEPAVTACFADGTRWALTRGELRDRVARLAQALSDLGIVKGDCVVAVMRNDAMAVIAALSVAAIGATLATSSPEMGSPALLERFSQLSPRLLIAHTTTRSFDNGVPLTNKITELAANLPTLVNIINLDDACPPLDTHLPCFSARALMERVVPARIVWTRVCNSGGLFHGSCLTGFMG